MLVTAWLNPKDWIDCVHNAAATLFRSDHCVAHQYICLLLCTTLLIV